MILLASVFGGTSGYWGILFFPAQWLSASRHFTASGTGKTRVQNTQKLCGDRWSSSRYRVAISREGETPAS